MKRRRLLLQTAGPTPPPAEKDYLCFTANTAGSTVELNRTGASKYTDFAYSTDRVAWNNFTPYTVVGTNTVTLTNAGDQVYFRGTRTASGGSSNYLFFTITGSVSASGNILSIYDATDFEDITEISYSYAFYRLFQNCTALTTAPKLPATGLLAYSYYQMFKGCTNLTTIPALPCETIYSNYYEDMFKGCTSLQVYNSAGTGHANEWKIPTSGSIETQRSIPGLFTGTTGDFSSGSSTTLPVTVYTQNPPVS